MGSHGNLQNAPINVEVMHAILLFARLQETGSPYSAGTGTEWLVLASILVPVAILILLAYLGRSRSA